MSDLGIILNSIKIASETNNIVGIKMAGSLLNDLINSPEIPEALEQAGLEPEIIDKQIIENILGYPITVVTHVDGIKIICEVDVTWD